MIEEQKMQDRSFTHFTASAHWMVKRCQDALGVLIPSLIALSALLLAPPTVQAQSATKANADPLPVAVATIPLAGPVQDFLLDPANQRIYVTTEGGTLTILDATDYTVLATLPVGGELTLDPRRPRLYVAPGFRAFGKPSAIQIIDTATLTVSATISDATHLSLDPQHARIFVGHSLLPLFPPNPPIGGLRMLDAATLATLAEAAIDGIPVYNPRRDELLLITQSLLRVDPTSLEIRADLFPAITAQSCKDCIGSEQVYAAQVLDAQNLLAVDISARSTPTGGRLIPAPRFLNATTLAEIPLAGAPLTQPTCQRRMDLQPVLDNRIYRHQAYASTFLFHHWRIENAKGVLLDEIDGLDAPFLNPNTGQAYASGWVLALPALRPVGRMPTLTCILAHDAARGLIYARRQHDLLVLAESGSGQTTPPIATPRPTLPQAAVTQIALSPNVEQDQTLFVTQSKRLYRSSDGGKHWLPLTNLPLQGMTALHVALSPSFAQDQTLFVGAGEAVGRGDQVAGGVFRSTDGGDSWQPAWQGLRHLRISDVALSPNFATDQTVLVYAHYRQFAPFGDGQSIQRSTDGGLTWSRWITLTDAPLPPASALLPQATAPPTLPIRLVDYGYQLARTSDGETWEGIDLPEYLGSEVRALMAALDFVESGVVYVLGASALWRVREQGAIIEPWDDVRLAGRTAYTEVLTSLALSPRYADGSYRLVIGTGGGEVWLLNPAEMAWQPRLTVVTTPLTARQTGGATQPLFAYTLAQTEPTQLVVRNMDGSHRRAVTLPAGIDDKRVHSFAPDGTWLAYYTGAVSRPNQPASDDLALHLLNVASGELITVANLLPSDFPANLAVNARWIAERIPEMADDAQLTEGIWWGFAEALTLHAWSPDGRQLAFAGAIDGPSSDLYLFDLATRTHTRLTDGPEQITALRWSPDGQWIWHKTVSIGFCQGCYGHKYAAAADGSRILTIPGDENDLFLGWLGPERYLESDGANGIGDFHLYEVNLTGAPGRDFWFGSYNTFVINWESQRMLIQGSPTRSLDPAVALYQADLNTGQFITTTRAALPSGVAARLFQPPLLPCPFGNQIIDYPCDNTPFSPVSPDNRWWVDSQLTLHTLDKRPILANALPQQATQIFWRRDSAGFYFIVAGDLYYRPLLDSWPVLIERGVANLTWLADA